METFCSIKKEHPNIFPATIVAYIKSQKEPFILMKGLPDVVEYAYSWC
jgi:hypothetical protein